MSIPQRPKRLIGSTRYGVALEPKSTTFSPTINGTVYFFDGKHAIETHPFSSLDQLAKMCYNFWEGTITGQLNFRRFSFWFSEFLSDFGIQNINEDKLEEELIPLNTGVALKRTGHRIREAKVVYDEPVKPSPAEKPLSYRSLLSSPGVPVKEAKVVYYEPVDEKKPEPTVTRKEKEHFLGETAADVRARLKPTGVPIREAKVVSTPIEKKETSVRKLQPSGSFRDIRQIETTSEPIDKKVKTPVQENVLPLPKKRLEPPENKLARPSEILDKGPTRSPKVKVLPPLKREESKPSPPEKRLLKPSEVLKERETIFDKERKMFDIEERDDNTPSERLLKPSEYLRKREAIPVISRTVDYVQEEKKEHTLLKPSEILKKKKEESQKEQLPTKTPSNHQEKILSISKPTQKQLENVSKAKKTVSEEIPSSMKIDEHVDKESQYSLVDVPGIGESKAKLLKEAGIENVEKLANASIDELVKIKGIGPSTAEKYITNAKKLLGK
ncbi:MAG: helix-hairpin-helix domain-containing protein [Candidatus Heimdallarchaeaceae archaeon]